MKRIKETESLKEITDSDNFCKYNEAVEACAEWLKASSNSKSSLMPSINADVATEIFSFKTCVDILIRLLSLDSVDEAQMDEFIIGCKKHKEFNWSIFDSLSLIERIFFVLLLSEDDVEDYKIDFNSLTYNTAVKVYYLCRAFEKKWFTNATISKLVNIDLLIKIKGQAGKRVLSFDKKIVQPRQSQTKADNEFSVLVVASVLSPNPNSAHYSLTLSFLQTLLASSSANKTDVYFALSGESTFDLFDSSVRGIDGSKQALHLKLWEEIGGERSNFYNGALCQQNSYEKFKSWVDSKEPSVILFIGDVFESIFFRKQLYYEYPTSYIPMAMSNDPRGFVDGVICKEDAFYASMLTKYGEKTAYPVGYPFVSRMVNKDLTDNKMLIRQNEHDKLILTPLRGERLHSIFNRSLSDQEIDNFYNLIVKNPALKWVFLGDTKLASYFSSVEKFSSILDKQLFCLDATDNFATFVEEFDIICAIPHMTGGNQSVSYCMEKGIAAVAGFSSDSCGVIPSDLTYKSFEEFISVLELLIDDETTLSDAKIRCKQRIESFTPEILSARWIETLTKIAEQGKQRLRES